MKKLMTILVISGLTLAIFAQTPEKMSYQAVIRDASGALVTNHAVGMRVSILQGSASGTVVYRETYSPVPQTNANGLVTVEIGSGTPSTGTFANINWGAGPYYLKAETDPNGGSSYTISGTSQLLSVPYALNSKISESVADNSITSAKIVDGTLATADLANSAVTAPKLSSMGATNGQVLRFNGTAWSPAVDGLSLPFTGSSNTGAYGIRIEHTNNAESSYTGEFYNHSQFNNSCGVRGVASAESGRTVGGSFISNSPEGTGVIGSASASTGKAYGGWFQCLSTDGTAVSGIASAESGQTYGGSFFSNSTQGIGVWGSAYAKSGATYGGYFYCESTSGRGVLGYAAANTGTNYGIRGKTNSPEGYAGYFEGRFYTTGNTTGNTDLFYVTNTGTGRAIHAVAASNTAVWGASTSGYAGVDGRNTSGIGVSGHSDTNYGVYGKSNDNYGVFGTSGLTGGRFEGISIGVYGISTGTSGINYGVYGKTNSSSGYAGYFEGNVKVTGTLSKGGGSFEIDHPLDPANKILRHSFVESPDMMNVYNGNIRTDANGNAEVILPDYFESLNRDFRYQLTVIGEFAQAIISGEISDDRFTIRTDKPNVKVSWQVTGIRKDPWAAENRIVVEEKKNQTLQGHYLYPELYGNSENRSIVRVE